MISTDGLHAIFSIYSVAVSYSICLQVYGIAQSLIPQCVMVPASENCYTNIAYTYLVFSTVVISDQHMHNLFYNILIIDKSTRF